MIRTHILTETWFEYFVAVALRMASCMKLISAFPICVLYWNNLVFELTSWLKHGWITSSRLLFLKASCMKRFRVSLYVFSIKSTYYSNYHLEYKHAMVLSGPVLSSPVLSCPVLSCLLLPDPLWSCLVLSGLVRSCPVLSGPFLSYPVLSCLLLSCPVPSCSLSQQYQSWRRVPNYTFWARHPPNFNDILPYPCITNGFLYNFIDFYFCLQNQWIFNDF